MVHLGLFNLNFEFWIISKFSLCCVVLFAICYLRNQKEIMWTPGVWLNDSMWKWTDEPIIFTTCILMVKSMLFGVELQWDVYPVDDNSPHWIYLSLLFPFFFFSAEDFYLLDEFELGKRRQSIISADTKKLMFRLVSGTISWPFLFIKICFPLKFQPTWFVL